MARLPYLSQTDLDVEYQSLLDAGEAEEIGEVLNLFRVLAHNPELFRSYSLYGRALWQECGLSPRRRELVILAVAYERQSEYEWHQHVDIATEVGVRQTELRAIADGDFSAFPSAEQALLNYVSSAVTADVTDEDHAALVDHFEPSAVLGIIQLVGFYTSTALSLDALDVELETPFVGWDCARTPE